MITKAVGKLAIAAWIFVLGALCGIVGGVALMEWIKPDSKSKQHGPARSADDIYKQTRDTVIKETADE